MKRIKNLLGAVALAGALTGSVHAYNFEVVTSNIVGDTRWNNDTVYILADLLFIESGTLSIEPGTIIRGLTNEQAGTIATANDRPGGLVVSRNAKIIANGTPDRPIIFTSIDDPFVPGGDATIPTSFVNGVGRTLTKGVNTDYGDGTTTLPGNEVIDYSGKPYSIFARWSGLIIAGQGFCGENSAVNGAGTAMIDNPVATTGKVPTNVVDDGSGLPTLPAYSVIAADPDVNSPVKEKSLGGDFIEGLAPTSTTDDEYVHGFYGGTDDSHDSGCIRWVSIRYSGFELETAKELQGLTPAGLGTGTEIEWVETSNSSDDGAEFFGGKNDTRYMFAHYNSDDSMDGDEGHRGLHQFWSIVQSIDDETGIGAADEVIEFDGAEDAVVDATVSGDVIPQSDFNIYNMTVLTNEDNSGAQIDADGGADLSIFGMAFDADTSIKGVFDFDDSGTLTTEDIFHTTGAMGDTSPHNPINADTEVATGLVVSNSPHTAGGIDQRLKTSVTAAIDNEITTTPVGLAYAPYSACQRNNTLTRGWTLMDAAGDNAATGVARVVVSGSVNSSDATKPAITFAVPTGAPANTIFHVYRSTDGCKWIPAGTLKDGSTNGVSGWNGATDASATADVVSFNDDGGPTLAAGSSVQYYVVAN